MSCAASAPQRPGGPSANALRLPADRANTTAIVHAERLLALADYGRPWELDLDTLDTMGPTDNHTGQDRTALTVLDAHDVEADPVAHAALPQYSFPGFHGCFTRRIAQ